MVAESPGINNHTEADVIGTPLGLVAQPHGRPAELRSVVERAAAPHARVRAVAIGRATCPHEGIDAAGQLRVIPVAAPLEDIAVKVAKAPRVGRVTSDAYAAARGRRFCAGPVPIPCFSWYLRSHLTLRVAMPAMTSGSVPKFISQSGNVVSRSLPSTPM